PAAARRRCWRCCARCAPAAAAWTWWRTPRPPRPARPAEIPPHCWSGLPTASAAACFCSPSHLLCHERPAELGGLRCCGERIIWTVDTEPAAAEAPACPAAGAQRGHLHRRPGGLRPRAGGAGAAVRDARQPLRPGRGGVLPGRRGLRGLRRSLRTAGVACQLRAQQPASALLATCYATRGPPSLVAFDAAVSESSGRWTLSLQLLRRLRVLRLAPNGVTYTAALEASKMLAVVAGVAAYCGWQGAFVPPAGRHVPIATAAGAAAMLGTAPAYADKIDDAAK
ncbi:unnamed protein product, partial [Effrenium voratum]